MPWSCRLTALLESPRFAVSALSWDNSSRVASTTRPACARACWPAALSRPNRCTIDADSAADRSLRVRASINLDSALLFACCRIAAIRLTKCSNSFSCWRCEALGMAAGPTEEASSWSASRSSSSERSEADGSTSMRSRSSSVSSRRPRSSSNSLKDASSPRTSHSACAVSTVFSRNSASTATHCTPAASDTVRSAALCSTNSLRCAFVASNSFDDCPT